jgi:hypothetical protein
MTMRAVALDAPQYVDDYEAASQALEKLKGSLATRGYYEEAFRVSEMLRDIDRARPRTRNDL